MAARILLVDDNKDPRDSVRMILEANGYSVVRAAGSEAARSLVAGDSFDVILLGIALPGKTGFLEFLKENRVATKVIVITGAAGSDHTVTSSVHGTKSDITRPYNPEYLLKSIEHALSDRSQRSLKLQIIRAGDFIRSTLTGEIDLHSSRQGFAQIAAIGVDLQDYTVLIDLRDVKSRLSTVDIYELASELSHYDGTFRRKTAVLVRDDEYTNQASFFETVARNRGFEVRAFTVFEEAVIWLSSVTHLTEHVT